MTRDELSEIKAFAAELKLPPDPTALELALFRAVKRDLFYLIEEVERLWNVADAPTITDPLGCQNRGVSCEEAFGQTVIRWCENCQRRRMRDMAAPTLTEEKP